MRPSTLNVFVFLFCLYLLELSNRLFDKNSALWIQVLSISAPLFIIPIGAGLLIYITERNKSF